MPRKVSRQPVPPAAKSMGSKRRRSTKGARATSNPVEEYRVAIAAKTKGEKGPTIRVEHLDGEVLSRVQYWLPTGILALDNILGGGGLPAGRVVELYGPNHIGKSTILDTFFTAVQRQGGHGILVDTEGARDENYTRSLGVDVQKLDLLEFERSERSIENVVDTIFKTLDWWREHSPETKVLVGWDALGSTSTQEELESKVGEKFVAAAAKVMRQACRQVADHIGGTNQILVICNHQYQMVNAFGHGPKRTTYAGEALRLAASLRMELFHAGAIKNGAGDHLGREVGLRLEKNRLGPPGECRLAVIPGVGVDNSWTLYEHLVATKHITVAGSWSQLNTGTEVLSFQGWLGFRAKVTQFPELFPRLVSAYQATAPKPVGVLVEG